MFPEIVYKQIGFVVDIHQTIINLSRGKGDYYRLGHGNDSHVRRPQVVEVFRGKKIIDVAVGALHCLAVTEQGQVKAQ